MKLTFQALLSTVISLSLFSIRAGAMESDNFLPAREYTDDLFKFSAREDFFSSITTREIVAELESRLERRNVGGGTTTDTTDIDSASVAGPDSAKPPSHRHSHRRPSLSGVVHTALEVGSLAPGPVGIAAKVAHTLVGPR
ncbi:hypothetical protein CVT24_003844 [Panaeolus cyanescens]|uniref:Uncharacterized protein n=1 Tax=Panaeolus cyanescens TaxID=181874 RepID=A0A409WC66_9AGAR|nr:hypothetical protein CVT24_003844 [Panaeolus cyanescens]